MHYNNRQLNDIIEKKVHFRSKWRSGNYLKMQTSYPHNFFVFANNAGPLNEYHPQVHTNILTPFAWISYKN